MAPSTLSSQKKKSLLGSKHPTTVQQLKKALIRIRWGRIGAGEHRWSEARGKSNQDFDENLFLTHFLTTNTVEIKMTLYPEGSLLYRSITLPARRWKSDLSLVLFWKFYVRKTLFYTSGSKHASTVVCRDRDCHLQLKMMILILVKHLRNPSNWNVPVQECRDREALLTKQTKLNMSDGIICWLNMNHFLLWVSVPAPYSKRPCLFVIKT